MELQLVASVDMQIGGEDFVNHGILVSEVRKKMSFD